MSLSIIGSSFALLFLAEMGDKTQLIAMTLAQRHRAVPVAVGVMAAFVLLNVVAVLVGDALAGLVPRDAVLAVGAVLFAFFAWRSWRDADEDESVDVEAGAGRAAGIVMTSFSLILVAELGDKTQLTMVTLGAGTGSPWSVFVGGTLALWAVSLIGIVVGATWLRRIPARLMHRGAAALFALFAAGSVVAIFAT
ncbi:MAG: TMEM165/GDT1 family protein [Ectothiorhodospiraceae bacterium]|nr:TMEM165/GDT1 family protein [Ectothiorhodospiraceae bacterium]